MSAFYRKFLQATTTLILVSISLSCTEAFEFEAEDFENILVVEANVTNEIGTQRILVSRTFLSNAKRTNEEGVEVVVEDSMGNTYFFEETAPGVYNSTTEFGALAGRDYILRLQTLDDKGYFSSAVSLPPSASIERLEAVRTTQNGIDGVAIQINSIGETSGTGFYRYVYEETYKIVTFFNPSKELIVISEIPPELEVVDKTREERTCYQTNFSKSILVATSDNLSANSVNRFRLRFIERLDRIVSSRYSILVKQFSQSREANNFYEKLREFSSIESLFEQVQPGFITSNIIPEGGSQEKVIGFFEITSVSSQRLFFNFEDIFGNSIRYNSNCAILMPAPFGSELVKVVKEGTYDFAAEDVITGEPLVAPITCVDCNILGSNIVPEFWEE